jgi:hypothetical protein
MVQQFLIPILWGLLACLRAGMARRVVPVRIRVVLSVKPLSLPKLLFCVAKSVK